ncbi:hypothetical protein HAX54_002234 [Datura stramonium]|uniref:Uncharacterized protein n=1 Tax=Datura stramonium TaxID=4076 RepID=A0ABS8T4U5_DATST|nr:hypothetical protein [Datura stramonium]
MLHFSSTKQIRGHEFPSSEQLLTSSVGTNLGPLASYPSNPTSFHLGFVLLRYGVYLELHGYPMFQGKVDPKKQFLETKVNVCGSSGFSLILDDWCYANYITPRTVKCLEIPCVLKRHPYHGRILGYRKCEGLLYIW